MTKKSLEKLLPKKVLEKLPEKTKENLIIAIQKNSIEFHQKFPSAKEAIEWSKIYPDAPKKIFENFEKDAKHLRKMESKSMNFSLLDRLLMFSLGWTLPAGSLVFGFYSMINNYDIKITLACIGFPSLIGLAKIIQSMNQRKK
ncbi:MAG: hypothetical protein ACTSXL_05925 [Alphaproteobacteria bacterium]